MQQCILVYLSCLIISLIGITSSFYIRPMKITEDDIDLDLRLILRGSLPGGLKKRNFRILTQKLRSHQNSYQHHTESFIGRLFQLFDRNGDECVRKDEFERVIEFIIS